MFKMLVFSLFLNYLPISNYSHWQCKSPRNVTLSGQFIIIFIYMYLYPRIPKLPNLCIHEICSATSLIVNRCPRSRLVTKQVLSQTTTDYLQTLKLFRFLQRRLVIWSFLSLANMAALFFANYHGTWRTKFCFHIPTISLPI